jgi:hypothetical protein
VAVDLEVPELGVDLAFSSTVSAPKTLEDMSGLAKNRV